MDATDRDAFEASARDHLAAAARVLGEAADGIAADCARAGEVLATTFASGGGLLLCGNGGSAALAMHWSGELVGRFVDRDRKPLRAVALTADGPLLTALVNDFPPEEVFERQVRGLLRRGDALACLSTSGRSPNVLRAADAARALGAPVVALTGPAGGPLADRADACVRAPGADTQQVQEVHQAVVHALCSMVESALRRTRAGGDAPQEGA